MMYAVCENGGLESEYVRPERYASRARAYEKMRALEEAELAQEDPDYPGADQYGDPLCKFDVVGIDSDGNVTTEI